MQSEPFLRIAERDASDDITAATEELRRLLRKRDPAIARVPPAELAQLLREYMTDRLEKCTFQDRMRVLQRATTALGSMWVSALGRRTSGHEMEDSPSPTEARILQILDRQDIHAAVYQDLGCASRDPPRPPSPGMDELPPLVPYEQSYVDAAVVKQLLKQPMPVSDFVHRPEWCGLLDTASQREAFVQAVVHVATIRKADTLVLRR